MKAILERPSVNLQAPEGICAIDLASDAMSRTTADLYSLAGQTLPDILPDTKFYISCGVAECAVKTAVTIIGDSDKVFGTPDFYAEDGLACKAKE